MYIRLYYRLYYIYIRLIYIYILSDYICIIIYIYILSDHICIIDYILYIHISDYITDAHEEDEDEEAHWLYYIYIYISDFIYFDFIYITDAHEEEEDEEDVEDRHEGHGERRDDLLERPNIMYIILYHIISYCIILYISSDTISSQSDLIQRQHCII